MTRPTRSEMLADADLAVLEQWANAVLDNTEVRVHKLPSAELAHMQFRDPVRGVPFYLGEVLFHECLVEIDDAWGYGYGIGQEPERALYAAVLDAALSGGHPLSRQIETALEAAAEGAARRRAVESQLTERTRVRFEVLDA
jgi:alpha-D-ribose 1-methylphosphonate 5-triphosphate synthase subunit PhnG